MRRDFRVLVVLVVLVGAVTLLPVARTGAQDATPVAGGQATPVADAIDGMYDVGGHSLYLHCAGSGSPTIVYLHGFSGNAGDASGRNAGRIPSLVQDRYRICVYDRANTGRSDDVPGPLTGDDEVRDLHVLLERAGIAPPYVLLGASFGGLLAYQYALTYPDQVVGMLLLDAGFPDELTLEQFYPAADQLTHDQWMDNEEQIDQLAVYETTMAMRGNEPDIPVTYLLATPSNWEIGNPAYDDVVLQLQAEYVASFPRGEVIEVPSGHYMEHEAPEAVAEHLETLIARIGG
jgi:pimeloyl-ACP methyl ester carboxylesterase